MYECNILPNTFNCNTSTRCISDKLRLNVSYRPTVKYIRRYFIIGIYTFKLNLVTNIRLCSMRQDTLLLCATDHWVPRLVHQSRMLKASVNTETWGSRRLMFHTAVHCQLLITWKSLQSQHRRLQSKDFLITDLMELNGPKCWLTCQVDLSPAWDQTLSFHPVVWRRKETRQEYVWETFHPKI